MKKVLPGQKLRIPASTFNTIIDAAEDFQRRQINQGSDAIQGFASSGVITVRNQSGSFLDQFNVLGLTSVLITPSQNELEFYSRWAMNTETPADGDEQAFCVLQEPIDNGAMGKALIVGVTPVLMKRASGETSDYAGIDSGQTYLRSGNEGAQILWEETVADDVLHLAVVRLPHFKSGGSGNATVRVASTANLTPTSTTATTLTFGSAQSVDGVTPAVGELVLLKNQTTGSQNGVYKVGANNVWTRDGDTTSGMLVSTRDGTLNAGAVWVLRTNDPITVGTTALTYANRTYNEYLSVKAAATTKITAPDGITLATNDRMLVVSGTDIGAWEFHGGSSWQYLDKPLVAAVRQGSTYGLFTMFLNSAGTGYSKGQAVYV